MRKIILIIFITLIILIVLFAFFYKAIYTNKINKNIDNKKILKLLTPFSSTLIFSTIIFILFLGSVFIVSDSKMFNNPVENKTPIYGVDEYVLSEIGKNSIYAIYAPILNSNGEIPGYYKEVDESNIDYVVTIYYELSIHANQRKFIVFLEYNRDDKYYDKSEVGLLYKNKGEYINTPTVIEGVNNYVFFGYITEDVEMKIIYNQLVIENNASDYELISSLEKEVDFLYEK